LMTSGTFSRSVHAVTVTSQPVPAAIVSLPVASSRSGSWKRPDRNTSRHWTIVSSGAITDRTPWAILRGRSGTSAASNTRHRVPLAILQPVGHGLDGVGRPDPCRAMADGTQPASTSPNDRDHSINDNSTRGQVFVIMDKEIFQRLRDNRIPINGRYHIGFRPAQA